MTTMEKAVIVDALRTPIGRYAGGLKEVRPDDLAALVVSQAVLRNHVDPATIEDVYFGDANQAGEDNRNVARMAVLLAGLPVEIPAATGRTEAPPIPCSALRSSAVLSAGKPSVD